MCCCTSCMFCPSADFGDRPTDDLPEEAQKEMKQAKGTVYRMNDKPWWCAEKCLGFCPPGCASDIIESLTHACSAPAPLDVHTAQMQSCLLCAYNPVDRMSSAARLRGSA
jgi:hypothetical protein